MKVISLDLRYHFTEQYITTLRKVTYNKMSEVGHQLDTLGIVSPLMQLYCRKPAWEGLPSKFAHTSNLVLFHDSITNKYYIDKNRHTGLLAWHTIDQVKALLDKEITL